MSESLPSSCKAIFSKLKLRSTPGQVQGEGMSFIDLPPTTLCSRAVWEPGKGGDRQGGGDHQGGGGSDHQGGGGSASCQKTGGKLLGLPGPII